MEKTHSKQAENLIDIINSHPNYKYSMDATHPEWLNYYDSYLFIAVHQVLGIGSDGQPLFEIREDKMKKYIVRKLWKNSEEDIFQDGCIPNSGVCASVDIEFIGNTPEDVINNIAQYLGCGADGIERRAADEPDRIDFSVMENANGYIPSRQETEHWKDGKIKLWAVWYSAYMESIEPVELEEAGK